MMAQIKKADLLDEIDNVLRRKLRQKHMDNACTQQNPTPTRPHIRSTSRETITQMNLQNAQKRNSKQGKTDSRQQRPKMSSPRRTMQIAASKQKLQEAQLNYCPTDKESDSRPLQQALAKAIDLSERLLNSLGPTHNQLVKEHRTACQKVLSMLIEFSERKTTGRNSLQFYKSFHLADDHQTTKQRLRQKQMENVQLRAEIEIMRKQQLATLKFIDGRGEGGRQVSNTGSIKTEQALREQVAKLEKEVQNLQWQVRQAELRSPQKPSLLFQRLAQLHKFVNDKFFQLQDYNTEQQLVTAIEEIVIYGLKLKQTNEQELTRTMDLLVQEKNKNQQLAEEITTLQRELQNDQDIIYSLQEKQQTVGQVGTKNKEQDAKIAELTASLDAAGLHIETLKTQGATLLKNIEVKTMELQQIQLASTNKVKAEAQISELKRQIETQVAYEAELQEKLKQCEEQFNELDCQAQAQNNKYKQLMRSYELSCEQNNLIHSQYQTLLAANNKLIDTNLHGKLDSMQKRLKELTHQYTKQYQMACQNCRGVAKLVEQINQREANWQQRKKTVAQVQKDIIASCEEDIALLSLQNEQLKKNVWMNADKAASAEEKIRLYSLENQKLKQQIALQSSQLLEQSKQICALEKDKLTKAEQQNGELNRLRALLSQTHSEIDELRNCCKQRQQMRVKYFQQSMRVAEENRNLGQRVKELENELQQAKRGTKGQTSAVSSQTISSKSTSGKAIGQFDRQKYDIERKGLLQRITYLERYGKHFEQELQRAVAHINLQESRKQEEQTLQNMKTQQYAFLIKKILRSVIELGDLQQCSNFEKLLELGVQKVINVKKELYSDKQSSEKKSEKEGTQKKNSDTGRPMHLGTMITSLELITDLNEAQNFKDSDIYKLTEQSQAEPLFMNRQTGRNGSLQKQTNKHNGKNYFAVPVPIK